MASLVVSANGAMKVQVRYGAGSPLTFFTTHEEPSATLRFGRPLRPNKKRPLRVRVWNTERAPIQAYATAMREGYA